LWSNNLFYFLFKQLFAEYYMGAPGQGRTKLSTTTTTTAFEYLYNVQRPVTRVEPSELNAEAAKSCVTFMDIEEHNKH
jgi:hypothetical protein